MNQDYTYCQTTDCIHRRGCKRWVGNYSEVELKELSQSKKGRYIDPNDCIPNLEDVDCSNKYDLLDRFRYSDGSPIK